MSVLRYVASARENGRRLTDVAEALGLNIATAHRLLGTLVFLGLLVHRSETKSYKIGPELISLAAVAHSQFAFRDLFTTAMARIAEETGDTVFLQVQSGDETVCLARTTGAFAIAALVLDVGTRLPMGVGAAGLAMLAYMSDEEGEQVFARCAAKFKEIDLKIDTVRAAVRKSRAVGFGFQEGQLTKEVGGISVLLLDTNGIAAAVSVTALKQRMDPARRRQVAEIIRAACADIPGLTLFPKNLPGASPQARKPTREASMTSRRKSFAP